MGRLLAGPRPEQAAVNLRAALFPSRPRMPGRGAERGLSGARYPHRHLPAEREVPSFSPLVLQAGHVGEVVAADEHVARADRPPEVDDGAVPLVVIVVAEALRRNLPKPERMPRL